MKKEILVLAGVVLCMTGCSTFVNGTTQTVFVQANPSTQASCELKDSKKTYHVDAPGSVEVNRGDGPLTITCSNSVLSGVVQIEGEMDPDVVWGGHGGLVVDAMTGAYKRYPSQIIVPLGSQNK